MAEELISHKVLSLDFWQDFLGLEGVLADEPGDPKHPDVFQK